MKAWIHYTLMVGWVASECFDIWSSEENFHCDICIFIDSHTDSWACSSKHGKNILLQSSLRGNQSQELGSSSLRSGLKPLHNFGIQSHYFLCGPCCCLVFNIIGFMAGMISLLARTKCHHYMDIEFCTTKYLQMLSFVLVHRQVFTKISMLAASPLLI